MSSNLHELIECKNPRRVLELCQELPSTLRFRVIPHEIRFREVEEFIEYLKMHPKRAVYVLLTEEKGSRDFLANLSLNPQEHALLKLNPHLKNLVVEDGYPRAYFEKELELHKETTVYRETHGLE